MDACMDAWIDAWIDAWMDGCMDGYMHSGQQISTLWPWKNSGDGQFIFGLSVCNPNNTQYQLPTAGEKYTTFTSKKIVICLKKKLTSSTRSGVCIQCCIIILDFSFFLCHISFCFQSLFCVTIQNCLVKFRK